VESASFYSLRKFLSLSLLGQIVILIPLTTGLNNGLALTPPMGWMSWVRYACETNCTLFPKGCINEDLYMKMADALADLGFKDVGYEYVNIDDCWSEMERDPNSKKLLPDRKRFPSGIASLADYIHRKGLKFGIYSDIGTKTCAGYPGHLNGESSGPKNFFTLDAQTFAEWGVDSLKVDGCYANTTDYDHLYPELGKALNQSGRPILYACSWPAYQVGEGKRPDYASIAKHCNYWRNYNDIMDSWPSVLSIIDFYAENQDDFVKYHGPGQWFDPDMIIVGDFGLSIDEARAQFALWSIMSAPLLMSNDLRTLRPEFKEILLNRHVIDVDQDPLGSFGRRVIVSENKGIEVWAKKLSEGHFAVVYFNRGVLGNPKWVSYKLGTILNKILAKRTTQDIVLTGDEDNVDDGGEVGLFNKIYTSPSLRTFREFRKSTIPRRNKRKVRIPEYEDSENDQRDLDDNQNVHRGQRRRGEDFEDNPLTDLYYVTDLFEGGELIAKLTLSDDLVLKVNPSGVRMVRLIPRS